MRAAIILFPGINREGDIARALRQATGAEPANRLARRTRTAAGPGSGRFAGRILLRRLSALRRDRGSCADHAGGRRSRGARRTGAGRLQRLPDPVRGRPFARRFDAQLRNCASSARCSMSGSRTPKLHSRVVTRRDRWSNSPSRTARETSSPMTTPSAESRRKAGSRFAIATLRAGSGTSTSPNGAINSIAGRVQRPVQCAGFDAPSRKPDRPPGRRHGRTGAFRFAGGLNGLVGAQAGI